MKLVIFDLRAELLMLLDSLVVYVFDIFIGDLSFDSVTDHIPNVLELFQTTVHGIFHFDFE